MIRLPDVRHAARSFNAGLFIVAYFAAAAFAGAFIAAFASVRFYIFNRPAFGVDTAEH